MFIAERALFFGHPVLALVLKNLHTYIYKEQLNKLQYFIKIGTMIEIFQNSC